MKKNISRGGLIAAAALGVCALAPFALAAPTASDANSANDASTAQSSTAANAPAASTANAPAASTANAPATGAAGAAGTQGLAQQQGAAGQNIGAQQGLSGQQQQGYAATYGGQQGGQQGAMGGYTGQTYLTGVLQGTVQNVNLDTQTITIATAGGPLAGGRGPTAAVNTGAGGSAGGALGSNAPGGGGGGLGGSSVTLHARPFDIANFNPGDVVSLQFNDYNGVLWLQPQQGFLPLQSWSQMGTITGPVTGVNRATGVIEVRGETFRAHPMQTQGIFPGQFVSLSFAEVGTQPWVSQIQPGIVANQQQGGGR